MIKIAVLVSGGGTNLQALIDAREMFSNAEIALVLSSRLDVFALERAQTAGITTAVVSKKEYPDREKFTRAVMDVLTTHDIDLVVLAGFLTVLSPIFCKTYHNRIINIHPSLIPAFCGDGFYGLRVHEAALAYGVKLTGATAHYVWPETDSGPVIAQKSIDVLPDDTPQTLQRRVMEECEWPLLCDAVRRHCEGKLRVEGRKVYSC
ncbi:MAG: phosphoribosylglycinamide formyltransferase [Oscillospiraceae bacterium]|nr:phosphoribosylglycinamide formyltransferase [Oscillospiraceae bacterium]